MERVWQSGEGGREGRGRKERGKERDRQEGEGVDFAPLQEFLRAPMSVAQCIHSTHL